MSNFNVREILDRYQIEYKSSGQSSELLYYCPFHTHSDDKMGSSMINEDTGVFNCFACSEGGNIYKFVSKLENISDKEAYKLVSNNFESCKSYSLDKLKSRKLNVIISHSLSDKVTSNILNALTSVDFVDFKHRWLIICNWIKVNREKEKQILELYLKFNKEIKEYEQQPS